MSSRLRQHYLELWQLAQALKEGWLEGSKATEAEQLLKDAVANDPTLSSLNITSSKFLNDLISRLEPLILAQPEIPAANLPAKSDLKDWEKQRQKHLEALYQTQRTAPVVFRDYRQRLANIPQGETYLILKKYGLIDSNGNYNFTNVAAIQNAEQEISRRFTYLRYHDTLRKTISLQLENQGLPLLLLHKEIFGKEGVPGIIDKYVEEIANGNCEALFQRIESYLGGPIDFSAPGFQAALDKAIKDTHNDSLTLRFQGWLSLRAQEITDRYLADSSKFRYLPSSKQNELRSRSLAGLISGVQKTDVPREIDQVEIEPADQEIIVDHSTAFYGESRQRRVSYHSYTYNSLAKEVQREFGLSETERSTFNISFFMKSFADDPLAATLHYPYYSLIGLLPKPLKNLYWKRKKWQKDFNLWFGATTSPEGQRKALEKLGWTAIKAVGKQFGVVSQSGQWFHMSALGWLGDKAVTRVGEGLAWLPDRLGRPGKAIGKILHRRLGKKRKREDNILTGLLGVVWDLAVTTVTLLPKLAWWALNKIPAVQALRIRIIQDWYLAQYILEAKFPILKWLRIGKGIIGSIFKAAPHGLVTGGLTYLVFQNPYLAAGFGGLDWLYHIFRNLNKIPEIGGWATSSHATLPGRFFGWVTSSRWAYLPIKGALLGYGIAEFLGYPIWVRWLSAFGSAGLEYLWGVGIRPWMISKIPPFISKWLTGPLSKVLGFLARGLPGLLMGLEVGSAIGLPLLSTIGLGLAGLILWAVAAALLPAVFALNFWAIPGWFFGKWLVAVFGLTGVAAVLLPYASMIFFSALTKAFWPVLSQLPGLILDLLAAGFKAIISAISAIGISFATLLGYFLIIIVIVVIIIMIIWGAFIAAEQFQQINYPTQSECFAPTKIVRILDKTTGAVKTEAAASDILEYTIKLNPKLPQIDQVIIDDFIKISGCGGIGWNTQIQLIDTGAAAPFIPVFNSIHIPTEVEQSQINPAPGGPLGGFGTAGGTQSGCQQFWYKIAWSWQSPLISGGDDTIVYSTKVSRFYTEGAIVNALQINGEATKTDGSKANCGTQIYTYINNSAQDAAELAARIVNILNSCSITTVTADNIANVENCLSAGGIPQATINWIKLSATTERGTSYSNKLQCVGFILAIEAGSGGFLQNINVPVGDDGVLNARDYWTDISGYARIPANNYNNIAPGDILIWTSGTDGHIAIVASVNYSSDNQLASITIAEAMGDTGIVRLRNIPITDSGFAESAPGLTGWQRRNY